ncbi:MAG TPA: SpoIID/LytB domain-containing protein [Phycisphaerales bacterium]|nr:SpoIID/LytB domain-containing protein [Phycisphaerales bacterium]
MPRERTEKNDALHRRDFLAAMSAFIGAGALLSGCDGQRTTVRRPAPSRAGVSPPPPADVIAEPPFHPPIPSVEPTVRVRIRQVRGTETVLRIGSPDQWIRVAQAIGLPHGAALRGPLAVSHDLRGWSIVDSRGFRAAVRSGEAISLKPIDTPEAGFMLGEVSNTSLSHYPGWLSLVPMSDTGPDAFDVVSHVALEMYLPGVLARELYNHWHLHTHAAQAIAARSFACSEHAYFITRRHFDLTNTQSSQAYVGSVTHARSHEAVRMTIGKVLTHDRLLVPGYYSSCCGGRAARALDAIGPNPMNGIAPLHGRPGPCVCEKAPVYAWASTQTNAALTRRLVVFGETTRNADLASLTTIASIVPSSVNEHGRPTHYRITDQRRHVVILPAETLRRAASHTGQGLNPPERPIRSGFFEVSVTHQDVTFRGFGFGHGVGMCQYGAETLALRGTPYHEILKWYYPGAEIVQAYL